jgi:predicted permease
MRIPLLAGRQFNEGDTADSDKVVIINEKMARQLWPGRDPIGQMLEGNGKPGGQPRVVGVVGNVRHQSLEQEGKLEMYFPISQNTMGSVELVVRSKVAMESILPGVRAALRSVEPNLPTAEYQPLDKLIERAVSPRRFMVLLLTGFALAALVLASIGIYAVVSYTVTQRTHEIGIRMALGASTGQVERHVLSQTFVLAISGVALGIAGSVMLTRLAASLLYRLEPTDPLTFVVTITVLIAIALSAGYGPARRASRLDPMSALRVE